MSKKLTDAETVPVMLRAFLRPRVDYIDARAPWECDCLRCGAVVTPTYSRIASGGGGCRACGFVATGKGLRMTDAEARPVMLAADLRPRVPYPGSGRPWECDCLRCGAVVSPNRESVYAGHGCRKCASAATGERCALTDAETVPVMLALGLRPRVPYPGANNVPWECDCLRCGSIVTPRYANARNGHRGCEQCAPFGRDRNVATTVYLLRNTTLGAVKVGVTNTGSERRYQAHGAAWEIVQTWELDDGHTADNVEIAVLAYWRDECGAPEGCTREEMRADGHTETAPAAWPGVEATRSRIEALVA